MKPYPAYKDSGVEWLGEVPEGWEVLRLGTLFTEINEAGSDDLPILSVSIHSGVSDDELNPDELERKVSRSEDRSKYKAVQKGDLVYNMMRAWQGGFGSVTVNGQVSPAYVVARPKAGIDFITSFVESLLRTSYAVEEMRGLSRGVTDFRLRLYWDEFKTIRVALPPLPEQQAIARFLDKEVAKIDALVAEQRRLIVLLAEKRQAVISHAVTKGLNPATPLKPSGIDWLGDIPEGWEVVPLKRNWTVTDCKHVTAEFVDEGYPLASIREVQSRYVDLTDAKRTTQDFFTQLIEGGRKPQPGDLIFSRNATVGEVAQVTTDHPEFAMGQDVCLLRRMDKNSSADYLQEFLRSTETQKQLDLLMIGSTFKRVNVEAIRNLICVFPPSNEQFEIANFIQDLTIQFNALTAAAQSAITLLQERRAALISAAVTGKVDLRAHFAQSLSEPETA
jgi:type I restriction enzyme S subunit